MSHSQTASVVPFRPPQLDLNLTPDLAPIFVLAAKAGRAYQSTVMILGETGVGKTEIARHIHDTSVRSNHPFVKIDLSQATASLFEDELFGHAEGAYTGAKHGRTSRLAKADGGTVFLDEIGTLSFDLQARLLRLVQERTFSPLGSDKEIKIDVRFLVATSSNLEEKVSKGEFREDLYHRLNVLQIAVPPLRERKNDIIPLAEHFLKQASLIDRIPEKHLSDDAKAALLEHHWPGNVRTLQNEMNRATMMVDGNTINSSDLSFHGKVYALPSGQETGKDNALFETYVYEIAKLKEFPKIDALHAECMRFMLAHALEDNHFSKERTARFLGVNANTLVSRFISHFKVEQATKEVFSEAVTKWNAGKFDRPDLELIEKLVLEASRDRGGITNKVGELDNLFYQAKVAALKDSLVEHKFVQSYAAQSLNIHAGTVTKFIRENPDLGKWLEAERKNLIAFSPSVRTIGLGS